MSHIVIITGEASGDAHAARLVNDLKNSSHTFTYSGIGGQKMRETGVNIIQDIGPMNIMGFTEVLRHIFTIKRIFNETVAYLEKTKPDLLILVDYPGFNLRLAKKAKLLGIKILYYISPQLWAWKPKRIEIIKNNVDVMAVILPFEKTIYDKAKIPAYFVGNPLIEILERKLLEKEAFKAKWRLPKFGRMIGVLPGSRKAEIKRIWPILLKTMDQLHHKYPNLTFVMPIASTLTLANFNPPPPHYLHCITENTYELMRDSHSLMVTSGTATLEAALFGHPLVIVYKTSWINALIAKAFLLVPYIGLCNLLLNRLVVPELIQHKLTPTRLKQEMMRYLEDESYYQKVQEDLKQLPSLLEKNPDDLSLKEVVLKMLLVAC